MSLNNEHIQQVVATAMFSPSGDNSQPWTFEWDGNTLNVIHQESRASHPLNPAGIASMISFGCVLEAIAIAASEFHCSSSFTLGDFPAGDSSWAQVRFGPSTCARDPLSDVISQRTTDRRFFKKGDLPVTTLQSIADKWQHIYTPARIHWTSALEGELTEYIIDAEKIMMTHPDILPAVFKWVRLTQKQAHLTRDGLTWRNLGMKIWEIPTMVLIREFPSLVKFFSTFTVPQHGTRIRKQLQSSAGVVLISIPAVKGSFKDVVQAGRLMMRTWLSLTQLNYGVQPLTLCTHPIYWARQGLLDAEFQKIAHIYETGNKLLQRVFSLPSDRLPIWMIRTGRSTPLPERMRTFRRPVEQTLKYI
jgi:hypothetical protein